MLEILLLVKVINATIYTVNFALIAINPTETLRIELDLALLKHSPPFSGIFRLYLFANVSYGYSNIHVHAGRDGGHYDIRKG